MAARPDLAVIVETITVNFNRVRRRNPLIHHISNWVTLNDCANAAYAVGARPTMAFDPQEAILATNQADAIVWNLGTFNKTTASAIQSALLSAATRPIPVVIDPVAAQAIPAACTSRSTVWPNSPSLPNKANSPAPFSSVATKLNSPHSPNPASYNSD